MVRKQTEGDGASRKKAVLRRWKEMVYAVFVPVGPVGFHPSEESCRYASTALS